MAKDQKEAPRVKDEKPARERRESTRERLQFIRRASEKRQAEHRSGVHMKK
jgi:hypothetical protein